MMLCHATHITVWESFSPLVLAAPRCLVVQGFRRAVGVFIRGSVAMKWSPASVIWGRRAPRSPLPAGESLLMLKPVSRSQEEQL